ncbi:Putative transcriptional regulator [Minicystis rosea]|nr:Putative transcriptional regulator [Minicystis rosea]
MKSKKKAEESAAREPSRESAAPAREAGEEGASLRDRILDAGLQLMREQGATGLTQAGVARAAGVPQGHLTYYFPRKSDLVAAVARHSMEVTVQDLGRILSGATWPAEPTEQRARVLEMLKTNTRDIQRTQLLMGAVLASAGDRELQQKLIDSVALVRGLIAGGLGVHGEAGEADVELVLSALWGIGVSYLIHRDRRPPSTPTRYSIASPSGSRSSALPSPTRRSRHLHRRAPPHANADPRTRPSTRRRGHAPVMDAFLSASL